MGVKAKDFSRVLFGKTFVGNRYKIEFVVKNGQLEDIIYGKHINLHIIELCEKFKKKKTTHINDIVNLVKLQMIKLNEYEGENEDKGMG